MFPDLVAESAQREVASCQPATKAGHCLLGWGSSPQWPSWSPENHCWTNWGENQQQEPDGGLKRMEEFLLLHTSNAQKQIEEGWWRPSDWSSMAKLKMKGTLITINLFLENLAWGSLCAVCMAERKAVCFRVVLIYCPTDWKCWAWTLSQPLSSGHLPGDPFTWAPLKFNQGPLKDRQMDLPVESLCSRSQAWPCVHTPASQGCFQAAVADTSPTHVVFNPDF